MKILIIKLSAIGDVVQTLPALEAIKKLYPDAEITWLVEEAAAGILEGHPLIDRLMVSRRKTWIRRLKSARTLLQAATDIRLFLRTLKDCRFDIAIDFQGLLKSAVLLGASRAVRKIGFDGTRELSYLFLNERLPRYDIEQHALDRYLDVAKYLGARDPSPLCTLHLDPEISRMKSRISPVKNQGQRLVVINPVARWRTKLWNEKHFADLADRLISEKKAEVIFSGSPEDRAVIDRIVGGMKHTALNWAGETSLKELASLARLADLFITTDTGPMHLAAAAGGTVLALFGPTAPWRTGPYGTAHVVVRKGISCSPCFQRTCKKNMECMESISVQDVFDLVAW